ncbi:MAG: hypothetical protein WA705_17975 [Candidatus Ozemobacteraceae bacterium]
MNGIRTLLARLNALLLLAIIGLILGLSLGWERYRSIGTGPAADRSAYAAELLAHGLPQEAASELQAVVSIDPASPRSLKQRRVLAEIYMDTLGDYEKALAELVFIRATDPAQASATEEMTRRCMDRLGRVYDVQRRLLLEGGKNPLVPQVSSQTAIRLGNEEGATLGELERRLAQSGLPLKNPPREALERITQALAGELLMNRAAKRSGIQHRPRFLEQVRKFEENLILQTYLEEEVLKDVKVDDQALSLYLDKHREEFDSPLRVVYSALAFPDETSARAFVDGQASASPPRMIVDHINALLADLPVQLKSVKWESEAPKGPLGPIEVSGQWLVYPIHEVVPARRVPPDLARQQARLKLLEEKQGGRISETLSELARREELKIIEDAISARFFTEPASGARNTSGGKNGR